MISVDAYVQRLAGRFFHFKYGAGLQLDEIGHANFQASDLNRNLQGYVVHLCEFSQLRIAGSGKVFYHGTHSWMTNSVNITSTSLGLLKYGAIFRNTSSRSRFLPSSLMRSFEFF